MSDHVRTHAILDRQSREHKARKIEILTNMRRPLEHTRMLEIGSGSGFIVEYFARSGYGPDDAYGIDVADERQVTEGYKFQKVGGTTLPFPDQHFDFIITNHVIEHVGDRDAQIHHLEEINRCLRKDGTLYFAVPNKWRLVEPHYRLPFLSWLPDAAANSYMRLMRKGAEYDCKPLSIKASKNLLRQCGFEPSDVTIEAIRVMSDIEGGAALKAASFVPRAFWEALKPIIPTLIYVCSVDRRIQA